MDNDQEYSRNEKCWVDTSMRMAYYAEKVNNADNEREKLMLLVSSRICRKLLFCSNNLINGFSFFSTEKGLHGNAELN